MSSGITLGRYTLFDKIASGGMAAVYFGRLVGAAGFTRTVAIKRLHPHLTEEHDFVSMLIDEARLSARVRHPNVVQVLDVIETDSDLCLVMEYVHGESLAKLLRAARDRNARTPLPIASAVMTGVLLGLHAAHEATSDRGEPLNIVHRDVSPQNILVGTDGVARVIDFGVAKAANRLHTTRDGALKGKFAYMAPEQLMGTVSNRTDIYAAAVVFWETLVGRRLFIAEEQVDVFAQITTGKVVAPSHHVPEIPPELDAVVMRALAVDPSARFATAREMADALMRVVPPAQSTEVGAWVTEVATESLSKRLVQLSGIESRSSGTELPTDNDSQIVSHVEAHDDDVKTVASQPSSISVEAPRGPSMRPRQPRRWVVPGALGGVLLLGLGIGALLARPSHQASPAAATSSPATTTGMVSSPASDIAVVSRTEAPRVVVSEALVPAVSTPTAVPTRQPPKITTTPPTSHATSTTPAGTDGGVKFTRPD